MISRRIRHRVLSETKLGWKRSSVNCVYTKEISVILNKHNHVRRGMYKHMKHVQTYKACTNKDDGSFQAI